MKVISLDLVNNTFDVLTITKFEKLEFGCHLDYQFNDKFGFVHESIEPIFLTPLQFKNLLKGYQIELHEGEIALVKQNILEPESIICPGCSQTWCECDS